jgi:ADP-heptose:LPS heptosyltransferase
VLHPGAGARRKRWPAERYAALAERLVQCGFTLAATSDPADEDAVASLQAALSRPIRVLDALELRDLAVILGRASLVVGNDSGVTHLAALTGAPTLALFGPFDPAYWAPIGPRVAVLDAGRDCAHRQDPRDGCRQCDHLTRLKIDEVWAAGETLLAAANAE